MDEKEQGTGEQITLHAIVDKLGVTRTTAVDGGAAAAGLLRRVAQRRGGVQGRAITDRFPL